MSGDDVDVVDLVADQIQISESTDPRPGGQESGFEDRLCDEADLVLDLDPVPGAEMVRGRLLEPANADWAPSSGKCRVSRSSVTPRFAAG